MTLTAIEFIRRFLLHVVPSGFVRIRHYGFLANRVCREKLEVCRTLLAAITPSVAAEPIPESKEPTEGRPGAHSCRACGQGQMVVVEIFRPTPINRSGRPEQDQTPELAVLDTS